MKKIYIILILIFTGFAGMYSQTANRNYILTHTCTNDAGSTFLDQVQYFDGLGRPVQTVQKGFTPAKADLVTFQEYDGFGRESNAWLPAIALGNNGAYLTLDNFKIKSGATYNNATYNAAADANPYSYPVYETSPLNRVLQQFGPGADWQSNGKSVKTEYTTNSGTTGQLCCAMFTVSGTGISTKVYRYNFYPDAQLYVTKTTDEDGNTGYQFKDKLDQVVLTRQILNGANVDTYYIYDDFGNLCFVLPPLAADGIANGTWDETNSDPMKQYAYIYRYDGRNRCIAKKLPGCEPIYYVYDMADHLIFTQDGENRKKSEWQFSIPDIYGRTVLTGTCKNSISYSSNPLNTVLEKGTYNTSRTNLANSYTISGVTPISPTILTANYYDGYEFLGMGEVPNNPETQYNTDANYGACYGDHQAENKWKNKGLLTGTATAQMNPSGTVSSIYLYSVMYYNYRNRLVQTKANNPLVGGLEKEYIAYDFMGNPTGKKHIHSATGKTTQTELYVYTYDHAERLTKETHQLNTGIITTLAENTYDELGRLKTNMKGGLSNLNTTYTYNIRSWIKSISNPLFTETLYYNESYGGGVKLYNGNLSAMNWTVSGDKNRGYTFTYDNLSRLTAGNYLENGAAGNNYKTSYTYDKMGNIYTVLRYGKTTATTYELIDNLKISNTGNQLLKVEDIAANISLAESADFKNYSNTTPEYVYNANGAMTKDLNKGISDIQYNSLNLPRITDIISPVAEARNEYTYSASGEKLKVVQKWNPNYSTAPVIGSGVNTSLLTMSKTTEYAGNMIYENDTLKRTLVDGGYIQGNMYFYYQTDHQGNNRMFVVAVPNSGGIVMQTNHYYPFGMAFAETVITQQGVQPYKYNGKELDAMSGLNQYDYGARFYDPAMARFTTMDPLCERYYSISPYAYCANNPVNAVDPTGMDWYVLTDEGKMVLALKRPDDKQDRLYYSQMDKEGNKYQSSIDVTDKELLPQLAANPDAKSYNATTTNATDAFNVFKAAADASDFEWSLSGYKENGETKYYLNTEHAANFTETGESNNIFDAKDELFNVHSHWKADGSKGGSGYKYDKFDATTGKYVLSGYDNFGGSDGIPAKNLYEKTGKVVPLYVYHRYSQGLYKYTPWSSAERKWLNIQSGTRLKSIIHP